MKAYHDQNLTAVTVLQNTHIEEIWLINLSHHRHKAEDEDTADGMQLPY
jgi:hypothetical protein